MSGTTPFSAVDSDVSPALLPLASQQPITVSPTATVAALKDIQNSGTAVDASVRSKLNIIGSNAITDDSANDRVTIKLCDRGTGFPGSPNDQDEYCYLADATNGIVWRFKYRSGSASSYKWEFIGGPPLVSEVTTAEFTASAVYAALATAGPSIVLPIAGDYDVRIECHMQGTSGTNNYMSYDIGGTGAVDADSVHINGGGANLNADWNLSRVRRKTGLTAVTLTAKYKSSASTPLFSDRLMSVTPVRVSG